MSVYFPPQTQQLPIGQYVPGYQKRFTPRYYLDNPGDPFRRVPEGGGIPSISRPQFNFGGGGDIRQQLIDSNRLSGGQTAPYPEPRGRHPQIAPTQPQQQRGFGLTDAMGMGQLGKAIGGAGTKLPATAPITQGEIFSNAVLDPWGPSADALLGTGAGLEGAGATTATGAVGTTGGLFSAADVAGGAAWGGPMAAAGIGTEGVALGAGAGAGAAGAAGAGAGAAGGAAAGAGVMGAASAAMPWVAAAGAIYLLGSKVFKLW